MDGRAENAWDAIVRRTGGDARVQLLPNRASPWMDIDSYLPLYERKAMLEGTIAPMKTVTRFVANTTH